MTDYASNNSGRERMARDKVKTVEELAVAAKDAKDAGRTVVLCHGVFDLVHMGHVKHLEAAKREGDVLIVTITCDRHVNKGPGRPIFPDHMRAEMLGAMEYVDYVGINYEPTAEGMLRTVQPDVYVKGSDYENPEEDVTGGITREREALENHGGRIVFTKDITFSSSSLINRYLDVYDPPLRDFLDDFRGRVTLDQLLQLLDKVRDFRVLLIGDTIIDDYQYVEALGKPAKENIIATRTKGRELFAGGVIAAANHVADFCAEVEVITGLGGMESHENLVRGCLKKNVCLNAFTRDDAPTTRKTRFVDATYMRKLFEVYTFDDTVVDGDLERQLVDAVAKKAADFDVVIVTDFGHGLISGELIRALDRHARFLAINAQTNAGNQGFNLITKYPRADYICIDGGEARLAAAEKYADLAEITGLSLPARIDCGKIIVTGGYQGCFTYQADRGVHRIPAFTKTVVDTVGAGDAFLAITSPLVAAGGDMEQVGFVGNAVGAMKVGIVGHRSSIEKVPLTKFLTTLMK
jgi:rfaE bifunctional protein nucleotidyltransferase chain/domain